MREGLTRLLVMLCTGLLLAGCGGRQPRSELREYLEEATGTTVIQAREPAAFVHAVPELAASGRDYVELGPLLVSRGGERSFWLWLGVWSTVDRGVRREGAQPLGLGPVWILADGEPMELELQPADASQAGVRELPYATPVAPIEAFLVALTPSQVLRLGQARGLALADAPDGPADRLWTGDEHAVEVFRSFAERTAPAGLTPARTDP